MSLSNSRRWHLHLRVGAAAVMALALCMAAPVFAADSSSSSGSASVANTVFRWLNFVLVFGGAAYLIGKNGGGFFRSNAQAIAADIRESSVAKAAAERELQTAQSKLSGLNAEIEELRRQAASDAAAEADRLRASGLAEIEKIKSAARAELVASGRVAQQQLRAVAASVAVDRAAVLLQNRMTPEARARMFQAFLNEITRGAAQRSMN